MKKRISLLLILALVLSLLAGCTSQPGETEPTGVPDDSSVETENGSAEEQTAEPTEPSAADEPVEPSVSENVEAKYPSLAGSVPAGVAETVSLPIVEDGSLTLSLWYTVNDEILTFDEFQNGQNLFFTEWQNRTGIALEMMVYGWTQTETFNLMLVSEEYPDMCIGSPASITGGIDKAIEDEVILRLNELIDDYAPNYKAWIESDEGNRRNNRTDEGNIAVFTGGYDELQGCNTGYGIRQDWLDELGLALPETYADWHTVLTAFKNEKTEGTGPLALINTGISDELLSGYHVAPAASYYMIQRDDVVYCSALEDGFRDYLGMMNQWYTEGLIDPDFTTNGQFRVMGDSAHTGIAWILYNWAGSYFANAGMADADAFYSYLPRPVQNSGEVLKANYAAPSKMAGSQGIYLFSTCADAVAATKMIDYLYTYEGTILMNYGVENKSFYYDEAGHPWFTDELVAASSTIQNVASTNLMFSGPGVTMVCRETDYIEEYNRSYGDYWTYDGEWTLKGSLSYTADEGAERASIMSDCSTYIAEFAGKVILGQQELNDETWNQYLSDLEKMNIARAVEITQTAYDRYLAR